MIWRSSIFALSPFHLRTWPSQLRTFAHFQLHAFELSTFASSPYRRKCEGTNGPNGTQQWNTLELHVYTSLCSVWTVRTFALLTISEDTRVFSESAKLRKSHIQSLSLNIYISENADGEFFSAYIWKRCRDTHVPKRIDPETLSEGNCVLCLTGW